MRPRARPDLTTVELPGDELVVSREEGLDAVILNPTGAAVLDLCDGQRTDLEIAEFLCAHLSGADPDAVRADVAGLLARLVAADLVEDLEPCGPASAP